MIFLVAHENSQRKILFTWRPIKTAKKFHFLVVCCYRQGKVIFLGGSIAAAKKNLDRQGKSGLV